jgi:hypothetical protein
MLLVTGEGRLTIVLSSELTMPPLEILELIRIKVAAGETVERALHSLDITPAERLAAMNLYRSAALEPLMQLDRAIALGYRDECAKELKRKMSNRCKDCGQTNDGQTGIDPCATCGLPTVWDEVRKPVFSDAT